MFALSSLRIFSNGVFMMLGVKMKSLASVVFTLKKKIMGSKTNWLILTR